jgi:hypothetical protein
MAKKQDNKKRQIKGFIEWFPLDKDTLKEALSVKARRLLAQRMIRTAREMAVKRKIARARFAPPRNLKIRAQKLARSVFRKRMAGTRGQAYKTLGMADKIYIDKMVDKQAPAVKKMVRRLLPAVKRAEANRLASMKVGTDNKQDKKHMKKFHGATIEKSR